MKPLRLFLGIPIPGNFNAAFNEFIFPNRDIAGIRWTPETNWHITVYFFGGVEREMLANLEALLELGLKEARSYDLVFEKYDLGPSAKSPRMIWARFQKQEAFRAMVNRIHELYLQINPAQQMRKSPLPHVTLARIKDGGALQNIDWKVDFAEKNLSVKQLNLWESILGPSGAEYKLIRQFQLSANITH